MLIEPPGRPRRAASIGQVDVELPGGERVWSPVVRMHRAVSVVLLDDQDQVLLLWRYRFVKDSIGGELPGGLVDRDEDPADAAVRELEEQTGYRAGRLEPVMTFEPLPGVVDAEHVVFVGRDPERVTDPVLGGGEIAGVGFLPIPSVQRLIAQGRIWNAEITCAVAAVDGDGRLTATVRRWHVRGRCGPR